MPTSSLNTSDPTTIGARAIVEMVATKKISAAEVFAHFRTRAEQHAALNALVHIFDFAAAADGILHGVPIVHKDIFCQRNAS